MELGKIVLEELIPQLDQRRREMNLTYQNLADACSVSQRTIIRLFKQETPPAFALIQQIVATLEMDYVQMPIAPDGPTQDEYNQYLRDCIDFERKDKKIRLDQQTARHNRAINEIRRTLVVFGGILGLLVAFICAVLIYDLAHPDRGWIQSYLDTRGLSTGILLAVRQWWIGLWA